MAVAPRVTEKKVKMKAKITIRAGNSKEAAVTQDLVVGAAAAAADPPAMVSKDVTISKSVMIGPAVLAMADVKAATKVKQKLSLIAIAARRRAPAPPTS